MLQFQFRGVFPRVCHLELHQLRHLNGLLHLLFLRLAQRSLRQPSMGHGIQLQEQEVGLLMQVRLLLLRVRIQGREDPFPMQGLQALLVQALQVLEVVRGDPNLVELLGLQQLPQSIRLE